MARTKRAVVHNEGAAQRADSLVREMRLDANRFQTPWLQTPQFHSIVGMPRTAPAPLSLRLVFARNIRLMRIDAGVSQERMAADAGLDRAFVGTLERGQRNISIDNIELIARAIGAPAHELMHPDLPKLRGLDESVTRAPRTVRPYPVKKR
jgi:DNA-binding XRE family transcriptional regulator